MAFRVFRGIALGINKEEIIDRIRKGDEKALETLYVKYYRMMIKMVVNNNGTEDEGKDVYQDALIALWHNIRTRDLIIHTKISTYLYGMCLNLWRKELRRKRKLEYKKKDRLMDIDPEKEENKKIVAECIEQLDETCKKVLMYRYFDGMSMQEIADKLGFANTNTTKVKKYKCKNKLKKIIAERYKKNDLLG